jgi:DNA invertase Pin-like site-specific DNA recombinase
MQAVGIGFVTLGEGIDTTSPTGRLVLHVLGAIAEFERERIRERVVAGLKRARAQGKKLGRPRAHPATIEVPGGSVRAAATAWGVSKSTAARWIATGQLPYGIVEGQSEVKSVRVGGKR